MRDTLLVVADQSADSCGALVLDTVALLEGAVTPEDYRSKWAEHAGQPQYMESCSDRTSVQAQEESLWSSKPSLNRHSMSVNGVSTGPCKV